MTSFHPATGRVHVKPVTDCTNPVPHGWLKEGPAAMAAAPPPFSETADEAATSAAWRVWRAGLTERFTVPEHSPPLRILLVWDDLTGHNSAETVVWLCRHGIMPLYTPLGGGRPNRAESIQRVLERRALAGRHPRTPAEIGTRFERTADAWNRRPTPFLWGGKRRRRRRQRAGDGHAVGGSAARTQQPLPARRNRRREWHLPRQVTH